MRKSRTLFLDLDGVLIDLFRGVVESPLGRQHPEITVETLVTRYHDSASDTIHEVYGQTEDGFWNAFDNEEFWANLPPYPWTPDLIAAAEKGFDEIFILTAPSTHAPSSAGGKMRWVERHLPDYFRDKRTVLANRKELLAAPRRILLDDSLSKAVKFGEHDGLSALFPQPYNYKPFHEMKPLPRGVVRPNNYEEVIQWLAVR